MQHSCVTYSLPASKSNRSRAAVISRHSNRTHSLPFLSGLGPYKIVDFPSDKHVIVRSVIYDPRPRDGFINSSVFMVEFRRHMGENQKLVVACGIGEAVSTRLRVRVLKNLFWVHRAFPWYTHDMAMIDCFGLPETPTGSRAFLWYRLEDGGDVHCVESEHPYFIPIQRKPSERTNPTIVVCLALVRHVPPFLREFLRYYKYLGVDHVYMVAEDSIVRDGTLQSDQFVQEAVREGFLSYTFWNMWFNVHEIHSYSYHLGHEDCLYRFQGTYDYAFIVDFDDHFIPLTPHQNSLDYYIRHYCRQGTCCFQWREYYPKCGVDWTRLGPHGNVTNTLLSTASKLMDVPKCIHRVSALTDIGTHRPMHFLKGYSRVGVPPEVAYVSHVRVGREPPNGRQSC